MLFVAGAHMPAALPAQDAAADAAQLKKWQPYRQGKLPTPEELPRLLNTWTSNLGYRLDASPEQRAEAALRRSFSALSLGLLVEHDNQHPFLRDGAFGHNRRLVVQAVMIRLLLLPEQTNRVAASLDVVRQPR